MGKVIYVRDSKLKEILPLLGQLNEKGVEYHFRPDCNLYVSSEEELI